MSSIEFWIIHGVLGTLAVLVIFPLGILKRQAQWGPAWATHSLIQAFGMIITLATAGIGFSQSQSVSHIHQQSGLCMVSVLFLQLLGGLLCKTQPPTARPQKYVRWVHIIIGFACLFMGWFSFVTGLVLASWEQEVVITVGLSTAIEVAAIPVLSVLMRGRSETMSLFAGSVYRTLSAEEKGNEENGSEI